MDGESKWLTSVDEVPEASEESLRRQLVTPDGRGARMKEAALEELLMRAREEGRKDR